MSLLFESIACLDGELQNLSWHEARLNRSRQKIYNVNPKLSLENIDVPLEVKLGLWKCRIIYGTAIEKVEFERYSPKLPKHFKLVKADIKYQHKYLDREEINQLVADNSSADEIIIVQGQLLTDTSIGNLIFYDGATWYTPEKPLLKGTMRDSMLASNNIKQRDIKVSELGNYQGFMMINALNPFDQGRILPMSAIQG